MSKASAREDGSASLNLEELEEVEELEGGEGSKASVRADNASAQLSPLVSDCGSHARP